MSTQFRKIAVHGVSFGRWTRTIASRGGFAGAQGPKRRPRRLRMRISKGGPFSRPGSSIRLPATTTSAWLPRRHGTGHPRPIERSHGRGGGWQGRSFHRRFREQRSPRGQPVQRDHLHGCRQLQLRLWLHWRYGAGHPRPIERADRRGGVRQRPVHRRLRQQRSPRGQPVHRDHQYGCRQLQPRRLATPAIPGRPPSPN